MTDIKMYWWNETPNFGDALNPYLVEKLSGQKVVWSPLESANIVGAGSLLQWITKIEDKLTQPLHVWGSGYMYDQEPPISNPLVKHHAVRGYKSSTFGKLDGVKVGDSGLLANMLTDKSVAKRYQIGIVPHLWHLDDPTLAELLNMHPNIKLIDVRLYPLDVIRQIAECEFVYSSSLHGLVVADSFSIPNQWIQFSTPLFGGNWKFEDYYSVFNVQSEPLTLKIETDVNKIAAELANQYRRPGITTIRKDLLGAFPSLHSGQ
jgi:pyruvyltransferase